MDKQRTTEVTFWDKIMKAANDLRVRYKRLYNVSVHAKKAYRWRKGVAPPWH
jgi:hypothetical protein